MPLYVPIGVRAEKSAAEMPKRLTLTLRLPSAAAVALNAVGGVDVGGVGVDGLRDVRSRRELWGAAPRAAADDRAEGGGRLAVRRTRAQVRAAAHARGGGGGAGGGAGSAADRLAMGFQREGVVYALRHGGRCLIADEMG